MILVDSSVWIEYYRARGDARYQRWVAEAIRQDQVAVNAIVAAEILTFTRDRGQYAKVEGDFTAFHWTPVDRAVGLRAADLGFRLRRKGLTVPATDLLIFASALAAGAELMHHDGHFPYLAQEAPLKLHSHLRMRQGEGESGRAD